MLKLNEMEKQGERKSSKDKTKDRNRETGKETEMAAYRHLQGENKIVYFSLQVSIS